MSPVKSMHRATRNFAQDTRAVISAELVLVLPMLCWAFFATVVFNDAYRARTQAQAAALHVADAISRETNVLTMNYLEGMNDVYDFLIGGTHESRLRITSVVWDRVADQPLVLWSYGTRGMNPLPESTFQLMAADELGALRELLDGEDGTDLVAGFTQMPVEDLHRRIPPVMPGEALVLVESFTMWDTPVNGLFLGFNLLSDTRLSPIAVVRPRFAPFINFEGAMDAAPPDADEFDGVPYDPDADPNDPTNDFDPTTPVPPEIATPVNVVSTDFTSGPPASWSNRNVSNSGYGSVGRYLGPFGRETGNKPVTIPINFGQMTSEAIIEVDLVIFDKWLGYDDKKSPDEGEYLLIQINGSSIALKSFKKDAKDFYANDSRTIARRADGVFVTDFELLERNVKIGGGKSDEDQLWRLRIHAYDPDQLMTLGFSMISSQNQNKASFGLSSVTIDIAPGYHQNNRFTPSQTLVGTDQYTDFPSYSGCPEHRLGGVTHTLSNEDLKKLKDDRLDYKVKAGGNTQLSSCPGLPSAAKGHVNADPDLILNWTNGSGNKADKIIIRTDDHNKGKSCDAVLLIRDPNGQHFYNGWIKWDGKKNDDWNARIDLGKAQSGQYHIWIGQWRSGYCETDIQISVD